MTRIGWVLQVACLGVAAGAVGCRADDCVFAHFIADLPATVRHGGEVTTAGFQSGVSPQTVGPRVFAVVEQVLLTDASPVGALIWTIGGPFGDLGWGEVALAVPTPVAAGAERTIDTVFAQTGWGESLLPPGSNGAASLRVAGFAATDAVGTVTVVAKRPLLARIALTLLDAAGDSLALAGDLTIRYQPETGSCEGIAQRVTGW